ncbi:hypothetical protein [Marinobacterium aestuariivivens]|uniref:AsmA domain-containing protein n=1 Tax=Marinobacterium aestuariivivens TaxID=1698799 RepID=A0ABW1ZVU6_9GAMM
MMLRRALWLLIPLLLLGLLYAGLPALASYVLTGWLESRGFEQPQLQLAHPGRNRLLIRHFSLGQQQPQRHLALTTDSIEVEYAPLTLLLEQRLTLIRIPRIELRVRQTGTAPPDSAPFDLATMLPTAWLGLAPADRLQVGQLTLSYDSGGGPEPVLQGNFDLQQGQLISRLQLFSASRPLARLDLQLDGGNRFEARLTHDNAPLYQARGTLHRRDAELDIDLLQTLALDRARDWQQQWLPLAMTLPGIEGELHSEGRLQLPLQLDLAATDWWRALSLEQQLSGELRLQAPVAGLERLTLPLDGRLQVDNGHLQVRLPAGGELQFKGLELGAFGTSALTTRLASTLELDASLDDLPGSAMLAPLTLELASARLQHDQGSCCWAPRRCICRQSICSSGHCPVRSRSSASSGSNPNSRCRWRR